ncbi:hypothetical protein DSUL_90073 [Desulfovibrionales bacterium]
MTGGIMVSQVDECRIFRKKIHPGAVSLHKGHNYMTRSWTVPAIQ